MIRIAQDASASPSGLLRLALTDLRRGPSAANDRAVILVDFAAFRLDSPAVVAIGLVEALIDLLAEEGWRDIAIVSTQDSAATWLENRGVATLADLLGYQYMTPSGAAYDIVDLAETGDTAAGICGYWRDAALRIVLAKCRTDQQDTVALCANTLLYALPRTDKDYHYRLRMEPSQALLPLLTTCPPQLAIVDAWEIVHGSGGLQAPVRLPAHAIIAGDDVLAVDCATTLKMGADPLASPVLADLIGALGQPALADCAGSLARFPGLRLPDVQVVDSTRRRNRSPTLARLVTPWLQQVDTDIFPFRHPLDARCNALLAHRLSHLDDEPASRAALVGINWWLGACAEAVQHYRIGNAKDFIARITAPVSPETMACTAADYTAMVRELDDLRRWLDSAVSARGPLRWRRLGRAVLFEYGREFPVPFGEFTAQVDIARTISFMNDYIGGTVRALDHDALGRPLRQVERNVYLPQPNYMAWFGGSNIDVSKIESVHYAAGEQKMYWKTILSENGSAVSDDGLIAFTATGDGTRVTILGRQQFTLPPAIEALHLERWPALEDHLTEEAYATFFARTFANFEALLEGREIAIGRDWSVADEGQRPVETLAALAAQLGERLSGVFAGATVQAPCAALPQPFVDDGGFRHFPAPVASTPAAPATAPVAAAVKWLGEFWLGYGEMVRRDMAYQMRRAGTMPAMQETQ